MPRARTDWRAARAGDYLITNNMSDHARICLSDMITLCGGRAALLQALSSNRVCSHFRPRNVGNDRNCKPIAGAILRRFLRQAVFEGELQ